MNRKLRRAALSETPPAAARLLAEAAQSERQGRLNDAARLYKQALKLDPAQAQACNNLGRVLQAQGKPREAASAYARALTLMPQLFDQYDGVCATLVALLPPLGEALRRADAAWPQRLGVGELFGPAGLAAVADNALLLCLLESTPVRGIAFERLLTLLRAALLDDARAGGAIADATLVFACALAQQCFINDHVFATTAPEDEAVERIAAAPVAGLAPLQVAVLAMYVPLHTLANATEIAARTFPAAVDGVITRQIREPAREAELAAAMPRLTAVADDTSRRVRAQYEENPYPRWVHAAAQVEPVAIDEHLRALFPVTPFTPLGKTENLDILVAGCGTGWQATALAQKYAGANILAVDLSLASLSYAKRATPARLTDRIAYAQADILELGRLDRRFDIVVAGGVLHHMADLFAGWRVLLTLLRPGGVMNVGLYSEAARRDVVAARAFIAERGYAATPADIRRCRQDLLATPLKTLARTADFFTVSECRDLLFHVQETRVTIPQIKDFLAEQGLAFLGFEFDAATQQRLRAQFSQAGWSTSDLDRWHALETAQPDLFIGMYQFWVQKR